MRARCTLAGGVYLLLLCLLFSGQVPARDRCAPIAAKLARNQMEMKELNTEAWARYERTSRFATPHEREAARLLRENRPRRRVWRLRVGPMLLTVRFRGHHVQTA